MTDARWVEVEDDLASACKHFRNAARLYDEGGFEAEGLNGYKSEMALQHAMQSGHTSLEGALKRILEILGEELPSGANSHADLIKRVTRSLEVEGHERPAILSGSVARDVDESRRFRHRATHDYDNFEADRAVPAIEAARRLAESLGPAIEAFKAVIDPPSSGCKR
ncbi:hypothetical protein [Bosea sp. 685]|uniref:ribonuclease toxin HepT-like protein n=1 Tax=Bosea sp. 685 TaxID=3080057 RepID=UPI002892AD6A|nr:hypothetical protein [Bosea sp. 685]WNJ89615.1 hypothetical protein RMR04_24925 [Bosea sp. 685]